MLKFWVNTSEVPDLLQFNKDDRSRPYPLGLAYSKLYRPYSHNFRYILKYIQADEY